MSAVDVDSLKDAWLLQLGGLCVLVLAVAGTFTGKAYAKGGSANRSQEPFTYWVIIVVEYIAAAFMIWYSFVLRNPN